MNTIGFIALAHPDYVADGQAWTMAEKAVLSLKENGITVQYSGQLAVDTVSAEKEAMSLLREGCDGVILFFSSWIECPMAMTVVKEMAHLPLMCWGFPMWQESGKEMSTGSYVTYAMFRGVLTRIGHPFEEVLGIPGEKEITEKVLSFCRAAFARARLKHAKIGLVGYTSMSIYTGTFDHVLMRWMIGPEVEQSDSYSLIRRAEAFTEEKKTKALDFLKSKATCMNNIRPEMLDKAMGLYLAIEELRREKALDAINIKCQYEFSKEYGMTVCVPLSMAASENFVTSCEGDILCTVSMLILQYLTGQVIAYGDAITHANGVLKLSPCGFMPYQLAGSKPIITNFMENVGFTGIQNSFTMKSGKITLFRLVEDIGNYHFLCATGEGLASTKLRQGLFPALDIIPDCSMDELSKQYSGQHFAICYGDVTEDLKKLAHMLRIGFNRVID